MAYHYSFTVPLHKEALTAKIDNLISQFGLKAEPVKRENGIKYSLTFDSEKEKDTFDKALSNSIPELWINQK